MCLLVLMFVSKCLLVNMFICTHVFIGRCVFICTCVHVFMCSLVDMFICSCLFVHMCLYSYMFICTHVFIDIYICLFVHICLLIYMYMFMSSVFWWLWYSVTFYLFINIQILLFSIAAKNLFVIFVSNLLYRYTGPNKSFQVTWILFLCRIQYICSEKDLTVGLRLWVPKKKKSYIQWYSTHQIMTWNTDKVGVKHQSINQIISKVLKRQRFSYKTFIDTDSKEYYSTAIWQFHPHFRL
jgi:hypothetical protein